MGTMAEIPSVVQDGLDQFDQLIVDLWGLDTATKVARSSSGASLCPEDLASHVSSGSAMQSSV